MPRDESFEMLLVRLREGDGAAAEAIHERFVRRLVALAYRQFESWVRSKADHEDVVQSVFKSFFARCERGDFHFEDWDDLWSLLALITVRKCGRRRAALRADRRNVAREQSLSRPGSNGAPQPAWDLVDRDPTPDEAAMLTETVQLWLLGLSPPERAVTELGLQGCSSPQIAERLGRTERSVRRIHQHARERLAALLELAAG